MQFWLPTKREADVRAFPAQVEDSMSDSFPSLLRRATLPLAIALAALASLPESASAQYFGRNKVLYEQFKWQVLKTEHFDIHYYPEEEAATREAARMAERWYTRLSS